MNGIEITTRLNSLLINHLIYIYTRTMVVFLLKNQILFQK